VRCDATADLLTVSVTDQGPGVGPDDLERIFQPFSRGGQGVTRGGYGLGLAITRQAVKRHGGRVYASLPAVGGLTVTLELPRSPTASAQANDPA
jgi:two-component system OmpR family sensor kinase